MSGERDPADSVAVASFVSGELFRAAMGVLGAAMTAWVGLGTLVRG